MGTPFTARSDARPAAPPLTSATSVDVPPMSIVIASSNPASRAIRAAPTTPAAGPDTRMVAGCAAASASVATPPEERITSGSGSAASRDAPPSRSR
jgi:hypothetical protein